MIIPDQWGNVVAIQENMCKVEVSCLVSSDGY